MAYATTTDVQGLLPKWTISASSSPTTTQVSAMLADVEAEINVALANQGVSTPYATAGDFLDWLGKLSADGTAARTLKAMFPDSSGPMETPAYKYFSDQYAAGLKAIRDGSMLPPAAGASGVEAVPASYQTRYSDEEADDGRIGTPRFRWGDSGPESVTF